MLSNRCRKWGAKPLAGGGVSVGVVDGCASPGVVGVVVPGVVDVPVGMVVPSPGSVVVPVGVVVELPSAET